MSLKNFPWGNLPQQQHLLRLKYRGKLPPFHGTLLQYLSLLPRTNAKKLFTVVTYSHSVVITMVILFITQNGRIYHGMAVNYYCKKIYDIGPWRQFHKTFLELSY
jgi:hypothetical protein